MAVPRKRKKLLEIRFGCSKSTVSEIFDSSLKIREAVLYQIGCFSTHCVKGGGGGRAHV